MTKNKQTEHLIIFPIWLLQLLFPIQADLCYQLLSRSTGAETKRPDQRHSDSSFWVKWERSRTSQRIPDSNTRAQPELQLLSTDWIGFQHFGFLLAKAVTLSRLLIMSLFDWLHIYQTVTDTSATTVLIARAFSTYINGFQTTHPNEVGDPLSFPRPHLFSRSEILWLLLDEMHEVGTFIHSWSPQDEV